MYFWLDKKVTQVPKTIIKHKNAKPNQLWITTVLVTLEWKHSMKQEPVDLRVYNTTPEVNHDAVDIGLCFVNIYPLKRDLSAA